MESSLEETFDMAVESVSSGKVDVPLTEDALELYGLFTRVRKGKCTGPRPAVYEMVKRAKYDAWSRASLLSR